MQRRLHPTTKLRWSTFKAQFWNGSNYSDKEIPILEQWHNWEVLTDMCGWQPVEGGEWKEIEIKKEDKDAVN